MEEIMEVVTLSNGSVVLEETISLLITKYDCVAAVCWAIHSNRVLNTRCQLMSLVKKMIESPGIQGVVRYANKYKKHSTLATMLVERLCPEFSRQIPSPSLN